VSGANNPGVAEAFYFGNGKWPFRGVKFTNSFQKRAFVAFTPYFDLLTEANVRETLGIVSVTMASVTETLGDVSVTRAVGGESSIYILPTNASVNELLAFAARRRL
jgi:hypothetical protein